MKKSAIILLNMGGPDSLDAVEPFLFNLFSDRDIFRFPFAQKWFARMISKKRAPKVIKRYEQIGGKSPINEWTEMQRAMLEKAIQIEIPQCDVYTGMRYWKPLIQQAAERVTARSYDQIVLLPLYPHYSITTTGSAFNKWKRTFPGNQIEQFFVHSYHDHPKYIKAINERIDEALRLFTQEKREHIQILFSAHGTPISLEKKGDPYSAQIKKTVSLVVESRGHSNAHHLCFQSRVGPVKWLGPSTTETIKALAGQGKKHLLIVPISFVSDHIETLHELNIEYRHLAENHGIKSYEVMEGLNDSKTFIEALKDIALKTVKSEQSGVNSKK